MKTTQNTILITGGGSGIGFEIAKLFSHHGNTVIITGRNEAKLKLAVSHLNASAHYVVADITLEQDVERLVQKITSEFPNLNILVNNAGVAELHDISKTLDPASIARREMETNYFGAVNLTGRLLPHFKNIANAAVINISSIVAFAPGLSLPTYSASKAALHSYTQILRLSLASQRNIKVFEVMPPLVDTDFAKDIPSDKKISPAAVAQALFDSMASDQYEVHVASTRQLYENFLGHPNKALLALNGLPIQ